MTITQTLREIADWPYSISDEDWKKAMTFYRDLYPELLKGWHITLNDRDRNLLLLFAAVVAEDEGL